MLVHQKENNFFKSYVYKDGDTAVKSVYPKTRAAMDRLSQELTILSSLNSPYFVKPISAQKSGNYYRITTHWVENEELTDTLIFLHGLDEIEKALIDANIRHRDIRPPNILIKDNKPVLIDFGWAIPADEYDIFDSVLPYADDQESIALVKEKLRKVIEAEHED